MSSITILQLGGAILWAGFLIIPLILSMIAGDVWSKNDGDPVGLFLFAVFFQVVFAISLWVAGGYK